MFVRYVALMCIGSVTLTSTSLLAKPPILVLGPIKDRVAKTEADWSQMIPGSGSKADGYYDSPELMRQIKSLDGHFMYQEVTRWVTSNYIVQVRLSDGRRRGVIDGNEVRLLRDGPYRGYLLVSRHKYHDGGGSFDPTYVVRPDGSIVLMVPGSDGDDGESAVERWLKLKNWRAR